jgi:hypothetical protein
MTRTLTLLVLIAATGCTERPTAESAISQSLSGFWFYTWGCAGDCPQLDLGTDTDRTCFLAGIRGDLAATSHVAVTRSGGHYWLDVYNNHANELMADAACAAGTTNRTSEYTQVGNGTLTIGAGSSTRRCFLTSVYANAAPANAFSNGSDYARVYFQSGSWMLTNSQSVSPYASAWIGATCVDVPTLLASGVSSAPDPGTHEDALVSTTFGDTACGLTGIGGHFYTDNYDDGAHIRLNAPGNDLSFCAPGTCNYDWFLDTVNGKRAWYACVK